MKKILFFAMVCLSICLASCTESVTKTKISDNLYSVTQKGDNGKLQTSVCLEDGTEIIAPQQETSFVVRNDNSMIVATSGEDRLYYTMSGKPIAGGKISYFKKMKDIPVATIYSGIDAVSGKTVFYFPANEETIITDRKFIDRNNGVLGYRTEEGFVLRSLKNDNKEYVVTEPTFYVRCKGEPVKLVVVGKKTATIYDLSGERIKDIPIKQWDLAKKKSEVELDFKGIISAIKVQKPL